MFKSIRQEDLLELIRAHLRLPYSIANTLLELRLGKTLSHMPPEHQSSPNQITITIANDVNRHLDTRTARACEALLTSGSPLPYDLWQAPDPLKIRGLAATLAEH